MIEMAAKAVQATEKWRDDAKIQKLQFSKHWMFNFVCRMKEKTNTGDAAV
jgi:hypothetical protein